MRNRIRTVIALVAVLFSSPFFASAQGRNKPRLPTPTDLTLTTSDGVLIRCTYYPGGVVEKSAKDKEYVKRSGKEVVPVILLHGDKGRRNEYHALANVLQRRGHAVIAPDLRGHGDSRAVRLPNGDERRLDPERMRRADLEAMVLDVQAVKKFLLQKNNEGELNIELLCVVGAELGSIVAVNWAMLDWSRQQLPSFKQGRDVKALVLLTPLQQYRGVTSRQALRHPVIAGRLSMMLVVGQDDRKNYNDAKAINKRFERLRPEPTSAADKSLYLFELNTSLAGTKLVDPNARLQVDRFVATFINRRIERHRSRFAWAERKNPLAVSD